MFFIVTEHYFSIWPKSGYIRFVCLVQPYQVDTLKKKKNDLRADHYS